MKKKLFDSKVVFTLLQGIAALLMALGVCLAGLLLYVGIHSVGANDLSAAQRIPLLICGFASVAAVSVCCAVALVEFFRMCGRLKREKAFTARNQRTMGIVALCCLVAGGTLLASALVLGIVDWVLADVLGLYWFQMLVGAFLFLAVSAAAWALHLLVRKAVSLQEEVDLTV